MSAARYKLNGYDCGMEAAHDGAWVSHFDYAALLDTLASKDKALAEAQEQAKHYPTVAGENMRLREEIAEIRAENERWCDAAQATSAKLTAANAELARVRKAIEAGKLLANAAFNISRMSIAQIDAYHLLSLKAAQEAWDEALSASRALSQEER